MSTELHLTIKAETAADALQELAAISLRAAKELGVAPHVTDTAPELPLQTPAAVPVDAKGNGADTAPPAEKRTRAKRAPAADAAPAADREAIVKGLTELYMGGDPTIRERITAFRDGYGAQRLRELKDDALPEAQKLLVELQQQAGP
jgi:hypothetical protein